MSAASYRTPILDANMQARQYARESVLPVLVPAIEALLKEVKANGHLTYWIKKRVMRAAAGAAVVEVEVHFRMRNVVLPPVLVVLDKAP
ncbi:hypothetical protein FOZ63_005336 [Perkinsus olseni]|uniref:Uncharacterized protein n=1 Tax=Perkinsus olseni TaxID=32597 RepID=A0A7J6Q1D0_PEROL|nr:hypothetical protein FOZ63_005336 [Perkinsus olseni]